MCTSIPFGAASANMRPTVAGCRRSVTAAQIRSPRVNPAAARSALPREQLHVAEAVDPDRRGRAGDRRATSAAGSSGRDEVAGSNASPSSATARAAGDPRGRRREQVAAVEGRRALGSAGSAPRRRRRRSRGRGRPEQPVVGPHERAPVVELATAAARRGVPTPGSTTARCTAPGSSGASRASTSARAADVAGRAGRGPGRSARPPGAHRQHRVQGAHVLAARRRSR